MTRELHFGDNEKCFQLETIEQKIVKALDDLQMFTATPGCGVTRFPYSKEARDACSYLKKLMEAVGLSLIHI